MREGGKEGGWRNLRLALFFFSSSFWLQQHTFFPVFPSVFLCVCCSFFFFWWFVFFLLPLTQINIVLCHATSYVSLPCSLDLFFFFFVLRKSCSFGVYISFSFIFLLLEDIYIYTRTHVRTHTHTYICIWMRERVCLTCRADRRRCFSSLPSGSLPLCLHGSERTEHWNSQSCFHIS